MRPRNKYKGYLLDGHVVLDDHFKETDTKRVVNLAILLLEGKSLRSIGGLAKLQGQGFHGLTRI